MDPDYLLVMLRAGEVHFGGRGEFFFVVVVVFGLLAEVNARTRICCELHGNPRQKTAPSDRLSPGFHPAFSLR